ncbi:peptidyl-prolyl cis-trans isomerase [Spirochaetia bacterium]|nr:peptidyl-prolyl cis-trans isomerase [Spirochaetia bacterium]
MYILESYEHGNTKMIQKTVIALFLTTMMLVACGKTGTENAGSAAANGGDPDTSYAFGMILGSDLKSTGLVFDYDEFTKGFRDTLEDNPLRFTTDDAIDKIQTAWTEAVERQGELNRQKETEFFAENGKRSGVLSTASGLQYEVITAGSGVLPGPTATVEVHYEGTLLDGTKFDSSYDRNEPANLSLEMVIPGWAEGLLLMPVGSTYKLYIPSDLAYGSQGAGSVIPPYSTLIFTVELLSILE